MDYKMSKYGDKTTFRLIPVTSRQSSECVLHLIDNPKAFYTDEINYSYLIKLLTE